MVSTGSSPGSKRVVSCGWTRAHRRRMQSLAPYDPRGLRSGEPLAILLPAADKTPPSCRLDEPNLTDTPTGFRRIATQFCRAIMVFLPR